MNSFQLTFRHLVDANNVLAEPPPLHPAPSSIPPTSSCSSGPTPASSSSSGPTPASSSSSGPLQFITSERGKPKLIHDGYHYTYHQTKNSGHVAWRCVHNNKSCRTKGISCSATAVTTGTTTSSSLEYAKPHSHLPDPSKIVALKIGYRTLWRWTPWRWTLWRKTLWRWTLWRQSPKRWTLWRQRESDTHK